MTHQIKKLSFVGVYFEFSSNPIDQGPWPDKRAAQPRCARKGGSMKNATEEEIISVTERDPGIIRFGPQTPPRFYLGVACDIIYHHTSL